VTVEFPTSSSGAGGPDTFGPRSSEQPTLEALGVVPASRARTVFLVLLVALFSVAMVSFVGRYLLLHFLHRGLR
jgi:nitrate reductase NapE component